MFKMIKMKEFLPWTRNCLLWAMTFFMVVGLKAQEIENTVKGVVLSANGKPVSNVMIDVADASGQSTSNFITTDEKGNFVLTNLNANETYNFVFEHFDFETYYIDNFQLGTKEKNSLVIRLNEVAQLEETVIIGYGDSKRKNLTTSISKLNTDDVSSRNVTSAQQVLQGQVAGVNLSVSNGTPGGKSRVSIRGVSSINGDNEPLYVIDGIILSKSDASYNFSGEFVQDPLSMINSADIESIDVLKDAAATAIYGSRGANGVIIINTKKGRKGKTAFQFSQLSGIQTMPQKLDLLNSQQYIALQNEAVTNYNQDFGYTQGMPGFIDINKVLGVVPDPLRDIYWQDLIIRSAAHSTQTDFSASGGNDNLRYFNSIGYSEQEGMIKKSSLRRYSVRSNVEYTPNDKINLGFNISGSFTKSTSVPNGNQGTALFQRSLEQRPYDSPYLADGSFAVGGKDILRHNGVLILERDHTFDKNYQALVNVYGSYNFLKNLSFNTSYNSELRMGHGHRRQEIGHPYNGGRGWINDSRGTRYGQTIDNTLSYNNSFADVFDVNAMVGHSFFREDYSFNSVTGSQFPSNEFQHINAATIVTGNEGFSEYAIESYFGRLNLGYKDKYLVSGSLRYDGSSKFNKKNRFSYFPSASVAWVVSEENFMENLGFINFFKFRGSWGKTGNQDGIGNYAYFPLAEGGFNYDGSTGLSVTSMGNQDLKWEIITQTNFGVDLSLFKNRINLTYDYFIKESDDLLYNVPVLQTSGFSNMTKNIGTMENRGHEFSLESKNIIRDNFSWSTLFNISFIDNKVISLLGEEEIVVGGWNAIIEGQPLGVFFGFQHDGLYQNDSEVPQNLYNQGVRAGDIRFADLNGDGQINSSDRTVIGSPYADYFGGITNNFKIHNFDISLFATFSVGNEIASAWRTGLDHLGGTDYNNLLESFEDRWTGPGTSNWTPRATKGSWNMKNSSYYIEDGSYFRIKNLTIGYSFPDSFLGQSFLDNVRIFASINNIATFTKYSGYDPEASSGTNANSFGIDNLVTPQPRSFLLGINLKF